MVREFYIENETGQRFSMMDVENGCLLISPTGLGYGYTTEYTQIGNNFINNIRKLTQGPIGGELIFNKYDNYKKFIDFIEGTENLKFIYKVPLKDGQVEYFKDVDLSTIEKGEFGTDGVLRTPVVFNAKSLWYEQKNIVLTVGEEEGTIKWDFEWDSRFVDYSTRNLLFENKGHTQAPIKLEIEGYVKNPSIFIYKNGKLTASLELELELQEKEKLIYCTKDTELTIKKQNKDGMEENLFDLLNPNFINFIKLNKGTNQIKLLAEEDIKKAKITVYVEYKAV